MVLGGVFLIDISSTLGGSWTGEDIPVLSIYGTCLEKFGFSTGAEFVIEISDGRIVIHLADSYRRAV